MEIENIKFVDELADCLPIPLPEDDFDYSVGYLDEYNVFIKDIISPLFKEGQYKLQNKKALVALEFRLMLIEEQDKVTFAVHAYGKKKDYKAKLILQKEDADHGLITLSLVDKIEGAMPAKRISQICKAIGLEFFEKYNGSLEDSALNNPYMVILQGLSMYVDKLQDKLEAKDAEADKKVANVQKELDVFKENKITLKKFNTLQEVCEKYKKRIAELEKSNRELSSLNGNKGLKQIDKLAKDNNLFTMQVEALQQELANSQAEAALAVKKHETLLLLYQQQQEKYKSIINWIDFLKLEADTLPGNKEVEQIEKTVTVEPKPQLPASVCDKLERALRGMKVLVIGGHANWQNKIKEKYPKFTYIDHENVNFNVNILKTADLIFFNTQHCSHTQYFKIKENINIERDKKEYKERLVYVNNNNIETFFELLREKVLG